MRKNFAEVYLGTVSHCTLREEDLIPDFLDELIRINNNKHTYKEVINEGKAIVKKGVYETEETSDYLNETLMMALDELAPPYCYFGTNEGDGADFGFWVSDPFQLSEEFEGLKVSDTSEVPEDYTGEVLHINDHGNVTLYNCRKGTLKEVWAIV